VFYRHAQDEHAYTPSPLAVSYLCVVVVWAAAKIDFLRRYDPDNVSGYLVGYWPFWAAMIVLAVLGYALAYVVHKPGGPTNRDAEAGPITWDVWMHKK